MFGTYVGLQVPQLGVLAAPCVADPYYGTGAGADPYFNNVVLLLSFNGANGATTVVDTSRYGHTVSRLGTASLTNAQSKFGGTSSVTPGPSTASGWLAAQSSDYGTGSGNFTVECWARRDASLVSSRLFQVLSGPQLGFYNAADTLGVIFNATEIMSLPNFLTGAPGGSLLGQWVHYAFQRNGNVFRLYRNGTKVGEVTSSLAGTTSPVETYVGNFSGTQPWNGWMNDFRFTVGVARYDLDFTPPTAAFPGAVLPRTVLLLHGESLVDSSSTPKTLTPVSGAAVSTSQAKFGTGSLFLNGSSQYVTLPVTSDFDFGSGDFTVEAWVYPTAFGSVIRHVFGLSETLTGGFAYTYPLAITSAGKLQAYVQPTTGGGGPVITGATTMSLNTWQHIAFTRVGNIARIFVNGVLDGSSASWVDYPTNKFVFGAIGSVANGYTDASVGRFQGYIDDLRVTKGAARYTGNFTPEVLPWCNSTVAPLPIVPATPLGLSSGSITNTLSMAASLGAAPSPAVGLKWLGQPNWGGSVSAAATTTTLGFDVGRIDGAAFTGTVQYQTYNITAVAGVDYTAASGTTASGFAVALPGSRPWGSGDLQFGVRLLNPSAGFALSPGQTDIVVTVRGGTRFPSTSWQATTTPGNFGTFVEYDFVLSAALGVAWPTQIGCVSNPGYGYSLAHAGMVGTTQVSVDGGANWTTVCTDMGLGAFTVAAGVTSIRVRVNCLATVSTTILALNPGKAPFTLVLDGPPLSRSYSPAFLMSV